MANLLILGDPLRRVASTYRGTYRSIPHYVEGYENSHPANQSFFWFLKARGEDALVDDVQRARQLLLDYAALRHPQWFELIEATVGVEQATLDGDLLGYDITAGFRYSLIPNALCYDPTTPRQREDVDLLWQLTQAHFQPQLNQLMLFSDAATAQLCLDCMMALQSLQPGIFEHESVVLDVIGLWTVPDEARADPDG